MKIVKYAIIKTESKERKGSGSYVEKWNIFTQI